MGSMDLTAKNFIPKTEQEQELTLSHCNWTVVNKGLPSPKGNEKQPNRSKYKYEAKLGVILCPGWVKYELRKFYFSFAYPRAPILKFNVCELVVNSARTQE